MTCPPLPRLSTKAHDLHGAKHAASTAEWRLQGLYWTLPRDRVEELFEDEVEEEEEAKVEADEEVAKTKKQADDKDDDDTPAPLERVPTLVRSASMKTCTVSYSHTLFSLHIFSSRMGIGTGR
jgi:hypothetical protein